jgi:hypothetical protein
MMAFVQQGTNWSPMEWDDFIAFYPEQVTDGEQ